MIQKTENSLDMANTLYVRNDPTKRFILPLIIEFKPQEDITTFELAEAMELLLMHKAIMPYQIDMKKPYIRHFRITDPNIIEKNITTHNFDFTGENLTSISVNV